MTRSAIFSRLAALMAVMFVAFAAGGAERAGGSDRLTLQDRHLSLAADRAARVEVATQAVAEQETNGSGGTVSGLPPENVPWLSRHRLAVATPAPTGAAPAAARRTADARAPPSSVQL